MAKAEDIDLVCTCGCCPEQYDASLNGKQVGYLRLRWGLFTAECPDAGGTLVYSSELGDGLSGIFSSEEERKHHLDNALQAIATYCNKHKEVTE